MELARGYLDCGDPDGPEHSGQFAFSIGCSTERMKELLQETLRHLFGDPIARRHGV